MASDRFRTILLVTFIAVNGIFTFVKANRDDLNIDFDQPIFIRIFRDYAVGGPLAASGGKNPTGGAASPPSQIPPAAEAPKAPQPAVAPVPPPVEAPKGTPAGPAPTEAPIVKTPAVEAAPAPTEAPKGPAGASSAPGTTPASKTEGGGGTGKGGGGAEPYAEPGKGEGGDKGKGGACGITLIAGNVLPEIGSNTAQLPDYNLKYTDTCKSITECMKFCEKAACNYFIRSADDEAHFYFVSQAKLGTPGGSYVPSDKYDSFLPQCPVKEQQPDFTKGEEGTGAPGGGNGVVNASAEAGGGASSTGAPSSGGGGSGGSGSGTTGAPSGGAAAAGVTTGASTPAGSAGAEVPVISAPAPSGGTSGGASGAPAGAGVPSGAGAPSGSAATPSAGGSAPSGGPSGGPGGPLVSASHPGGGGGGAAGSVAATGGVTAPPSAGSGAPSGGTGASSGGGAVATGPSGGPSSAAGGPAASPSGSDIGAVVAGLVAHGGGAEAPAISAIVGNVTGAEGGFAAHTRRPSHQPIDRCPECTLKDQFKRFLLAYKKSHPQYEEERRFKIFQDNLVRVAVLSKARAKVSDAIFGLTKFSDLTFGELLQFRTGGIKELEPAEKFDEDVGEVPGIPLKFDWADEGVIPEPRDQLDCGSCYAFAASDLTGAQWAIDHGEKQKTYTLAPQVVLDCIKAPAAFGCSGGRPFLVLSTNVNCTDCPWPRETCYPYENKANDQCRAAGKACIHSEQPLIQVKRAHNLDISSKGEGLRLSALIQGGPIAALVTVTDHWQFYTGGIMRASQCPQKADPNHAVLITGYDFSAGTPAYIIKNSWGKDWGEEGYFRLEAGANACGVAEFLSFACTADCGDKKSARQLIDRAIQRQRERGIGTTRPPGVSGAPFTFGEQEYVHVADGTTASNKGITAKPSNAAVPSPSPQGGAPASGGSAASESSQPIVTAGKGGTAPQVPPPATGAGEAPQPAAAAGNAAAPTLPAISPTVPAPVPVPGHAPAAAQVTPSSSLPGKYEPGLLVVRRRF